MRPRARTARARPAVVSSTSRSSALTRRRCALSPRRAEQPVGATHEGSLRPRRRDGGPSDTPRPLRPRLTPRGTPRTASTRRGPRRAAPSPHCGRATQASPARPNPPAMHRTGAVVRISSEKSLSAGPRRPTLTDCKQVAFRRPRHGRRPPSPLREGIAMKKISMSRFQIHDELTAPEGSVPVLRGALATGGQLPNFLGVLAGAPAALRGYARFRSELRHGTLSHQTLERIAIAVAEHYHSEPGIALHARTARQAGIGLDELALAREFDSRDEREATLLRYLKAVIEAGPTPPRHLHEEAREAGWSDEQILEAVAVVALEGFTAMVNVAGDVPVDGSTEDARTLKAA